MADSKLSKIAHSNIPLASYGVGAAGAALNAAAGNTALAVVAGTVAAVGLVVDSALRNQKSGKK